MSFTTRVAAMDQHILSMLGAITITIHPSSAGLADYDLSMIVKNPAMEEGYVPGMSSPQQGVSSVVGFIRFGELTSSTMPKLGDTATFGGVDYDIYKEPEVDREGGATLSLRRRGERYDQ